MGDQYINPANGLMWLSNRRATVGLVVANGVVVQCPPYAYRWAARRDARQVWRQAQRDGYEVMWIPDPEGERD